MNNGLSKAILSKGIGWSQGFGNTPGCIKSCKVAALRLDGRAAFFCSFWLPDHTNFIV
jgi:hypothetical protein